MVFFCFCFLWKCAEVFQNLRQMIKAPVMENRLLTWTQTQNLEPDPKCLKLKSVVFCPQLQPHIRLCWPSVKHQMSSTPQVPITAADLQKRLARWQKNPMNNNTNNACGNSNYLVIMCVSLSIKWTENRPRAWRWRCLLSLADNKSSCLERNTNHGMIQERMFENC